MALSNWDTLAFNLNGPCSGQAANYDGWRIEIYKNWLNVHHDDVFVTAVQDGNMRIGQWEIRARRGPQAGIYVAAWSASQVNNQGEYLNKALLVGCGVYGFTDPAEEYFDLIKTFDPAPVHVGTVHQGDDIKVVAFMDDGRQIVIADEYPGVEFVGVQPPSVQYLRDMVSELIEEHTVAGTSFWPAPELAAIDWDHALRANQGDMYIETRAGTHVTGTAPGEADTPVLLQALRADEETDSSQ